jgi:hypothetical protein
MCYDLRLIESLARSNRRSGACEDSAELCAPYIGILPDESETADGSPLDFGSAPGLNALDRLGDGGQGAFWEGWEARQDANRKVRRRAKATWAELDAQRERNEEFARWYRRYPNASGGAILAKLKQASK